MGFEVGTMLSELPFSNFPIILKNTGMDFFIIDAEHGAMDYTEIAKILTVARLAGMPAIVRLADNSRKDIIKFMDMGAAGLLLPMTNSQADIAQVVQYAKYRPQGQRGISTTRAHTLYRPIELQTYMREANSQTHIYAQIETVAGIMHISEILSAEHVDGVFIGPNDLSDDLQRHPAFQKTIPECIEQVALHAKKANKQCGIITTNPSYINTATKCGIDKISYGSELHMLIQSCSHIARSLKTPEMS